MSAESLNGKEIHIYSDTHIDTWNFDLGVPDDANKTGEAIAIFAGDAGNNLGCFEGQLNKLNSVYEGRIAAIPGNHEWYRQGEPVLPEKTRCLKYIDGLKIVGSTLWTNFRNNKIAEWEASKFINDFRLIQEMTTKNMVYLFEQERDFLLDNADADIVVTHFPPILKSEHEKYKGDGLNPYFVNDDEELFSKMSPKIWIHGHTHSKFDYKHNGTRVMSNPRGYPGENYFRPNQYKPMVFWVD